MSNREYTQRFATYRGTKRVAIFLQRWPVYLQLSGQNDLGADLISRKTTFVGPWEPARINPRTVDVKDIDDTQVGNLLLEVLQDKGYQPFLAEIPFVPRPVPVEEIMAQYQALDREVDAFLFVFYSPTLYFSNPQSVPPDHSRRSYGLQEIIYSLQPGGSYIIWAGSRAIQAPANSINHAFIYLSMTLFKALDWQPLWAAADSQVGGRLKLPIPRCPPDPTLGDYRADAAIIQRLMGNNLKCRLRRMIPDSF